eukprot:NODE_3410_length_982_cov_21.946409_g3132_i0.p1 GENE.NODE_3410_length_982_cov_21.946409_g3132_i0~~NODE_3410_length_982_cov_21.946409_g3132_i0.p1  ORF type:complete len:292 (+),score=31.69 NODE_3410_length_982_cov_21.946409_g3132_i0:95-970(+)
MPSSSTIADRGVAFISGFVAGCVGLLVGHPFDTLKTRAQTGWGGVNASGKSVLLATLRQQGIAGLYRGILPPLLVVGWITSLTFTIFEYVKSVLPASQSPELRTFLAGGASAILPAVLVTPGYFVKIQLQNDPSKRGQSTLQFVQRVSRASGGVPRTLALIYRRQLSIGLACDMLGRASYFTTHATLKSRLANKSTGHLPLPQRIISAVCSGIVGWTSIYPLDTIRNRLAAVPLGQPGASVTMVTRQIWRESGIRGFYRGYFVTITRAAPVAGCVLTTYDYVHSFLLSLLL